MAFLVFEQSLMNERPVLRPTGQTFSLAGHNLLYRAWENRGRPLNSGWSVNRRELVELQFGKQGNSESTRLIIDFHPTSTGRIGLVEPINIHAYTWGEPDGTAVWTPLMLELRDVYYSEYDETLSPERKKDIMQQIPVDFDGYNSVEFLYLNGDALSWNWGRNGMTNAAFLFGEARDYFRGFF